MWWGSSVADSEALLDALWAHATQPRFAMCHEWQVGDLLMWNNLSVLHRRDPFDPKTRRVMHRSQIKGDRADQLNAESWSREKHEAA